MFKRGFAIIMVFSIVLSTLTASYANEKTDYFNDNHVVITQSGGIYEEIQLIEGRYYYFYKDETNNKVISIDGSTKKDISIYYNNNERLYKVENYRNNKFKFGTKEYFSEIKSDILKNSNLIKLDLVSSVQIKKIIHPQNDLTDFIEVRNGDSSALEHFISNTGRGYTDNLQVAKMVGGKYVQVFESKTHSVYIELPTTKVTGFDYYLTVQSLFPVS